MLPPRCARSFRRRHKTPRRLAAALFIAVAALSVGCNCVPSLPADGGSEAPEPIDAGLDAGREAADAGSSDAGSSDAGSSDAGSSDAGPSDAGSSDAGSSDAGPSDAGPSDAGTSAEVGCTSGTRSGFVDLATYPSVAACAGTWSGPVSEAGELCAVGWHVCRGTEAAGLASVTYPEATAFPGCFPFDAANDDYVCHPGCLDAVAAGVDTADRIDLAAVGADCPFEFPTGGSCLASGRVDAAENSGTGCNFATGYSGVVCCRHGTP